MDLNPYQSPQAEPPLTNTAQHVRRWRLTLVEMVTIIFVVLVVVALIQPPVQSKGRPRQRPILSTSQTEPVPDRDSANDSGSDPTP